MQSKHDVVALGLVISLLLDGVAMRGMAGSRSESEMKGYDIKSSGLSPRYPAGFRCSPLTSLYASWIDVDGSRRSELHSGLDGGSLGDWILSPGPGTVRAVWRANWGWGGEGALMIKHAREELNLKGDAPFYYSEFDHLKYDDVSGLTVGRKIPRGQKLARVYRPGGRDRYLPEVHWEVWEVEDDDLLVWRTNKFGGAYWFNKSARLIDPLYLLSRNTQPQPDGGVVLTPFVAGEDYDGFPGFTYILPCWQIGRSVTRPTL